MYFAQRKYKSNEWKAVQSNGNKIKVACKEKRHWMLTVSTSPQRPKHTTQPSAQYAPVRSYLLIMPDSAIILLQGFPQDYCSLTTINMVT